MFKLIHRPEISDSDQLIHDIAERAARSTMCHLSTNTAAMSTAELRGYVRTRALRSVREQIFQSRCDYSSNLECADAFFQSVLERTVHLVAGKLLVPPVAAIPAPHVRLRIAA
jgi:hypothetical protein